MSDAERIPVYSAASFSQLLSRVYRVMRTELRTQSGIAVIPAVAFFVGYGILFVIAGTTFLPAALQGKQPPVLRGMATIGASVVAFNLVYLIALSLFQAAASYAAVNADCGVHVTSHEAYRVARDRAGHYIGLMLSLYGICFLPAILIEAGTFGVMAIFVANKAITPGLIALVPIGVILLVAALIAGMIVALRLSLAFPASVFEGLNVRRSIKRSWELTRGAAGRIFLVALVIYAVMYLVLMVVMIIIVGVAIIGYFALSGVLAHPTSQTISILAICGGAIYIAIMSAFGAFFWMGLAASLSVIYNDQRMRMAPPTQTAPAGAPA